MSNNSPWEAIIPALISGGFGAGLATVVTAVVQTLGKKAESRATAAGIITDAAGNLAARQSETIARLEARVERQAKALVALTAVIDELLTDMAIDVPARKRLHKAIMDAKLSI